MPRKILGTKPRYDTWLDKTKSLTQMAAEQEVEDLKGLPKPKRVKKGKAKEFVSCLECPAWVTTRKEGDKVFGYCQVLKDKGHCPYIQRTYEP